jgi:hypothetical protein
MPPPAAHSPHRQLHADAEADAVQQDQVRAVDVGRQRADARRHRVDEANPRQQVADRQRAARRPRKAAEEAPERQKARRHRFPHLLPCARHHGAPASRPRCSSSKKEASRCERLTFSRRRRPVESQIEAPVCCVYLSPTYKLASYASAAPLHPRRARLPNERRGWRRPRPRPPAPAPTPW